jgi:hypothetical protein
MRETEFVPTAPKAKLQRQVRHNKDFLLAKHMLRVCVCMVALDDEGQEMQVKKLIDELQQAFDQSKPPTIPEPAPLGEGWEETRDFWGKSWHELTLKDFHNNSSCFAYFGDQNFPYFFGALMFHMLRENILNNNALDLLLVLWAHLETDGLEGDVEVTEFGRKYVNELDEFITHLTKRLKEVLNKHQKELIRVFFQFRWSQLCDNDVAMEKGFVDTVINSG